MGSKETNQIGVRRGVEIVGDHYVYKVRIKNDTQYVISSVTVNIIDYSKDCIELIGPDSERIKRIEPGGFNISEFKFALLVYCATMDFYALVSYLDHEAVLKTVVVEPYILRNSHIDENSRNMN